MSGCGRGQSEVFELLSKKRVGARGEETARSTDFSVPKNPYYGISTTLNTRVAPTPTIHNPLNSMAHNCDK